MSGTKYAISILDAGRFHDFIAYIRREYGGECVFEPIIEKLPKPWMSTAPFNISLVEDNEYGAVIEVSGKYEDYPNTQEEFQRYMSMFNIYAQPIGD